MGTIFSNIENFIKQKSALSTLLIINSIVFLIIQATEIFFLLFNISARDFLAFFELPASLGFLLHRPYTLITYMFTHLGFWHILFNLLWLYWFGQIFLRFFSPRQLGGLYVLGGLAGGLLFILSYNIFPYFRDALPVSYLIGASASVMAIVFAAAFYRKDLEISLFFFGNVKLIYIAIFFFVLDLVSIESGNPGGHIAHIGGALMGIGFAFYEQNKRKSGFNNDMDRILDKIRKSGYNSLSENEKKTLFNASK